MLCKIGRDRPQSGAPWYWQMQRLVRESDDLIEDHPDQPAIGGLFVIKRWQAHHRQDQFAQQRINLNNGAMRGQPVSILADIDRPYFGVD